MSRVAVPSTQASSDRQIQSTLRELDRKSAGAASGVEQLIAARRHHWHGNGTITAGGIAQTLTTWVEDIDDGIATFTGGDLILSEPGRWSVFLQYTSDSTESGVSACWLEAATGATAPWGPFTGQLRDERYRHGGFSQAGNLVQSVAWNGVVLATQAQSPIRPRVMWRSGGSGAVATGEWILIAHYLGAARLPDA